MVKSPRALGCRQQCKITCSVLCHRKTPAQHSINSVQGAESESNKRCFVGTIDLVVVVCSVRVVRERAKVNSQLVEEEPKKRNRITLASSGLGYTDTS